MLPSTTIGMKIRSRMTSRIFRGAVDLYLGSIEPNHRKQGPGAWKQGGRLPQWGATSCFKGPTGLGELPAQRSLAAPQDLQP
jgi:hypothetical protein